MAGKKLYDVTAPNAAFTGELHGVQFKAGKAKATVEKARYLVALGLESDVPAPEPEAETPAEGAPKTGHKSEDAK